MKRPFAYILTAFLLILSGAVFFGRRAYLSELADTFSVFDQEALAAVKSIDRQMDRLLEVFDAEVPLIESFLRERERSDQEITDYLRERTRRLSTGVDANFVDLYLAYRGRYLCGNYWRPPVGFDITARPWYVGAMKSSGRTAIISPYSPADYPHQVMAVSRRLESPSDVLAMDVQLAQLEPVVDDSIAGAGGIAFYIDPTGHVVAPQGNAVVKGVNLSVIAGRISVDGGFRLDDGEHFVFHRRSRDGWTAVLLHDRDDVLAPARWTMIVSGAWMFLLFLLVVLSIEIFRYRSDLAARWMSDGVSRSGRLTIVFVYVAVIAAFVVVIGVLHHESTKRENHLVVDRVERRLTQIAEPYEAFINTAKGASGYCSRHLEPLVLENADDRTVASETRRLIGIYRSLYGRNYRNIFVAQRNRYADSLEHESLAGFDPSRQHWYRTAQANPNVNFVYPPYVSSIDGVEQITITSVMTDPERTVVGIDISVQMLRTLCGRVRLPGARCAMIVAENGFVIDHHLITDDESGHGEAEIREVAERALVERHTFRMRSADGCERIVFCAPLSVGGCVLITANAELLDNALSAHYFRMLALLMPLFVSGLIILFLALRRVRRMREREIAERERARQAESLAKALDLAQSANRAKSLFLSSMSHDLRTPMNAIIGFTDLARADVENAEHVRNCLGKIAMASDHLLSLINDVLDMSRIESGRVTLSERPDDLGEIIAGVDMLLRPQAEAKSLKLTVESDLFRSRVVCDRLRLNQILINLVSNAIKYTPAGGDVSLRVTMRPSERAGWGRCLFIVKDNGIGMSAEFVKTVYEPFTREQTSTVSGIQGTGLGMAITKRLIEMKSGDITVDTAPGKGTEFRVTMEFELQD